MAIFKISNFLVAASICCFASVMVAEEPAAAIWETDFAAARQKAGDSGKDLFLNFTGSDWCGFCIVLQEQVLTKSAFEQEACEHFVLVALDYPRHKKLAAKLRQQNDELLRNFGVKAFPALMLADAEGVAYAQVPNQPGIEPEQLAAQMKSLRELREKRDELMKAAETLEGAKRAEKLSEALDLLDDDLVDRFYAITVDEIIALDGKDSLKRKKDRDFSRIMKELESRIHGMAKQQNHEGISETVDACVREKNLKGEHKQKALMLKLGIFGSDRLDDAVELLENIEQIKSDSETGREAAAIRIRVKQYVADQAEQAKL